MSAIPRDMISVNQLNPDLPRGFWRRPAASAKNALLFVIQTNVAMALVIVLDNDRVSAVLVVVARPESD